MMTKTKLMNRNFILVVIGQIISLFGNAILRFALPLYLLDQTGSSTVFGVVMACSFIPMTLLSPVGGILADRVNKRNIMVVLDFSTAALTIMFLVGMRLFSPIIVVAIVMVILSGIQAVYQPSVQASMPLLQEKENLMTANAIINQISALSGLLGPVIGGIVYGVWGLIPVVAVGCVCFFISAVMELFIRIPNVKQKTEEGIIAIVKKDMNESLTYMGKEKPIIKNVLIIIALINFFLTACIIVGVPVIIKITLGMSSQLYGYAQGVGAAGGLLGGILTGVLGSRLKIQNVWKQLFLAAVLLLPIGAVLMIDISANAAYLVVVACYGAIMAVATIFSVQMLVYIQSETPVHLTGKVISLAMAVSMCAQPIGQALYGILFDRFQTNSYVIVWGAACVLLIIVVQCRTVLYRYFGKNR